MKSIWYLIPVVPLLIWFYLIVTGVEEMTAHEKNNKFHAMLIGCTYLASVPDLEDVLYFDCNGRIELHKEVFK